MTYWLSDVQQSPLAVQLILLYIEFNIYNPSTQKCHARNDTEFWIQNNIPPRSLHIKVSSY